jgi:RNA polymerase sigma-70 factor (ECF subfamily)
LRSGSIFNPEDLEDLVQEIVLKLQSAHVMRRLQIAGSPAGYIAVMMKNAAIDLIRRRRREVPYVESPEMGHHTIQLTEVGVERFYRLVRLRKSVAALKHEDRILLRMRFWNNMSIAQIAENLNLSYSATAVRLFRVLRALREAMQ